MGLSDFLDVDLSKMQDADWAEVRRGVAIALKPIVMRTPTPLDDLAYNWLADALVAKVAEGFHATTAEHPVFGAASEGRRTLSAIEIRDLADASGIVIPPALMSLLVTMFASVVEALLKRWATKKTPPLPSTGPTGPPEHAGVPDLI